MSKKTEFNIKDIINKMNRYNFISEYDLQFIMGVAIKKLYKNATVAMEYCYSTQNNNRQYIDIFVIMDNKYYPIELKYKHKGCNNLKITDNLDYNLTNQSCTTEHRQKYCKDIERILNLRNLKIHNFDFEKGYAILLTNYKPFRDDELGKQQKNYLLHENKIKHNGINEIKAEYKKDYEMEWVDFDKQKQFSYLITTINKNDKIKKNNNLC